MAKKSSHIYCFICSYANSQQPLGVLQSPVPRIQRCARSNFPALSVLFFNFLKGAQLSSLPCVEIWSSSLAFSSFSRSQSRPASQAPLKMRRLCLAIPTRFFTDSLSSWSPFTCTWSRIRPELKFQILKWESPPLHSLQSWQHWQECGSEAFL